MTFELLSKIELDIVRFSWMIGVLGVFVLLSALFKTKIGPLIIRLCAKTNHKLDDVFANGFVVPFAWFLAFCGVLIALNILPLALGITETTWYNTILAKITRIGTVVFFTWGLWRSGDAAGIFISHMDGKLDIKAGETVQRFIINVFKIFIIAVAAAIIAGEFISNISGLIAGLGLGGLTIALAAKETASNFFGGIVIVFDKPFEIGDWVSCGAAEGIVEDIDLRCTKIRTFQNAIVMVPNAKLTSEAITNWSRMQMRKSADTVTVPTQIGTSALQKIIDDIKQILSSNEDVCKDTPVVFLDGVSYGFYKISLSYFTSKIDYSQYICVKNDINTQIMLMTEKYIEK